MAFICCMLFGPVDVYLTYSPFTLSILLSVFALTYIYIKPSILFWQDTGIWILYPNEPTGPSKGLGFMAYDEARHTKITEMDNNAIHSSRNVSTFSFHLNDYWNCFSSSILNKGPHWTRVKVVQFTLRLCVGNPTRVGAAHGSNLIWLGCQFFYWSQWFSQGTLAYSTNETDHHQIVQQCWK